MQFSQLKTLCLSSADVVHIPFNLPALQNLEVRHNYLHCVTASLVCGLCTHASICGGLQIADLGPAQCHHPLIPPI